MVQLQPEITLKPRKTLGTARKKTKKDRGSAPRKRYSVMGSGKDCNVFHLNGAALEEIVYPVDYSFSPDHVEGFF